MEVEVAPEQTGVQQGDLWAQHYPQLAGWCLALVGDPDVAHDIAAESFSRLMLKWRAVQDPKAYLFVVAGNQVRDHWRRQERDRNLLRRLSGTAQSSTPAADPWLRDLVERLPERTRTPVLLHYFADLPVRAVAEALGKPESTIKRALSDGREALLVALQESERD